MKIEAGIPRKGSNSDFADTVFQFGSFIGDATETMVLCLVRGVWKD